jgi:hypothetical protein
VPWTGGKRNPTLSKDMPEVFRTRDCHVLTKGDTYPVVTSEALVTGGWLGGSGLQWADANGRDILLVDRSDGVACGFALFGSDEIGDQHTSMTGNQPFYRMVTVCAGGWVIMTRAFEQYTYASRQVGPLVSISYQASDRLFFSILGLWTPEDELVLSGDPRAPNTVVGSVVQAPIDGYLTIQVSI